MRRRVFFIAGPTASGKTELAIRLAKKINAEIISCDSMQVYKEPRILTNKPSTRQRAAVAHHLIGVVSIREEFDVALFCLKARRLIREIHARGRVPLFVVGTGFYMKALLDGLTGYGKDALVRHKLQSELTSQGGDALYRRLQQVDPVAAGSIHPHNIKKILRALEIFEMSQTQRSKLRTQGGIADTYDIAIVGVIVPRDELYRRIDQRTLLMFQKGAVKEARELLRKKLGMTAAQILGLRQIGGYLAGEYTLAEAKRRVARDTRHYAKRQMTWLRKEQRIKWMPPEEIIGYTVDRFNA